MFENFHLTVFARPIRALVSLQRALSLGSIKQRGLVHEFVSLNPSPPTVDILCGLGCVAMMIATLS
jgi:hypothetical protein